MLMYVLDTDHLSLLEWDNADSLTLQMRLESVSSDQIATTVINYEEQMRGWLERAARADNRERPLSAYSRLLIHIKTFDGIPLLPFDANAADAFEAFQKAKIRVGTMDLKIAAIALANNATVLTRNTGHFSKVPSLKVEDWSGL
ncbi:MAG: type II toxin-antitoxin system VapC family toxin [Fibrella sp.]|nr:type II toxin-antitoxin system VapC family toxin [Armatimonadota bacterium]